MREGTESEWEESGPLRGTCNYGGVEEYKKFNPIKLDFKDHKETHWGLGEQRNIVIATVKNKGTLGTQGRGLGGAMARE